MSTPSRPSSHQVPRGLRLARLAALLGALAPSAGAQQELARAGWVSPGARWVLRHPGAAPSAPLLDVAYDAARERAVAYSGAGRETWLWDGVHWTRALAGAGPRADRGAMAYDPARELVVLQTPNDGTWEWDGASWARVAPAWSTPPHEIVSMAYDPSRGLCVLHAAAPDQRDEIWEWDGLAWSRSPQAPAPTDTGLEGELAYDEARGVLVLVKAPCGGTWELDAAGWQQRSSEPNLFAQVAAAWDPGRGRVVAVFSGCWPCPCVPGPHGCGCGPPHSFAHTRAWDGQDWSFVVEPLYAPWLQCALDHLVYVEPAKRLLGVRWELVEDSHGEGQGNSESAVLDLAADRWLAAGDAGPHPAAVPSGTTFDAVVVGPPLQAFLLLAGSPASSSAPFGCFGIPGVGGLAHGERGLRVIHAARLGLDGESHFPVPLPDHAGGLHVGLQALVLQDVGAPCPATLSGAFHLSLQ